MALDLNQDVFVPVVARIKERSESLRNIKRFARCGIEGWFKVEVVAALGSNVRSIRNKGPDLILEDGTSVEIKAATDFAKDYFIAPINKYGCPSLFLGDGTDRTKLTSSPQTSFEIVGLEIFSDGSKDWMVGMVKPKS
jgi:hypothetical protein